MRAELAVSHDDREVEFILLKREIERVIAGVNGAKTELWSCETWARYVLDALQLDRVEVSEDGENGAVVERVQ